MTEDALTPAQLFAARQLLGWKRRHVAQRVGVSRLAIQAFEVEGRFSAELDLAKVRSALETAGVEFRAENHVRLRKAER